MYVHTIDTCIIICISTIFTLYLPDELDLRMYSMYSSFGTKIDNSLNIRAICICNPLCCQSYDYERYSSNGYIGRNAD